MVRAAAPVIRGAIRARQRIAAAAGGERDNQADRLLGVLGNCGHRCKCRERDKRRCDWNSRRCHEYPSHLSIIDATENGNDACKAHPPPPRNDYAH